MQSIRRAGYHSAVSCGAGPTFASPGFPGFASCSPANITPPTGCRVSSQSRNFAPPDFSGFAGASSSSATAVPDAPDGGYSPAPSLLRCMRTGSTPSHTTCSDASLSAYSRRNVSWRVSSPCFRALTASSKRV